MQFCAFRLLQHNEKISANAQASVPREVFRQCAVWHVAYELELSSFPRCAMTMKVQRQHQQTQLEQDMQWLVCWCMCVCVCVWHRLDGVVNFYGIAGLRIRFILHRYNRRALGLHDDLQIYMYVCLYV